MGERLTILRLAVGYLVIGVIVNLASLLISPYVTVLVDGILIYLVFQMSRRWLKNYKIWTGLILGISCMISGFSALFLTLLCLFNKEQLFCERNPVLLGGLLFYLGLSIWIIFSAMKLIDKLKHKI